ncbi:MAG: hypothetical protein AAFX92_06095 [Pseudomonadota bacterium]
MSRFVDWIRGSRKFLIAAITTILIWLQSQGHIQLAGDEAAAANSIFEALTVVIGSITVYAVPNRPPEG